MHSKSIKILGLIILNLFVLSGCGASSVTNNNEKSLTIATSFYPMYVFALNVAQEIPNVKIIDMTKPITGCLHDYAVTPEDMKNLEGARFFITNGARGSHIENTHIHRIRRRSPFSQSGCDQVSWDFNPRRVGEGNGGEWIFRDGEINFIIQGRIGGKRKMQAINSWR